MAIVFCNIVWMEKYRGITEDDKPIGNFSWVNENEDAYESRNFFPLILPKEITVANDYSLQAGRTYCLGFFETMTSRNKRNEVHIENIQGAQPLKDEDYADGVTVVWCASHNQCVVGWYNSAVVLRKYAEFELESGLNTMSINVIARAEDCTLLPLTERQNSKWYAPRARRDGYGFGQSNIWYATKDEESRQYATSIANQISRYSGINAMDLD